jgi:hypothetical protein
MMIAHARGAALTTIALLDTHWNIAITPDGPGTEEISPQEYFDNALVETAILNYRAFVCVTEKKNHNLSNHTISGQARSKKLLRRALSHNSNLLATFDWEIGQPFARQKPRNLPSIPVPSATGTIRFLNDMADKQLAS